MDFNATIDLIIKDLDEAREIIDDLKKYAGVPALQVELAKSKCKSAGEVIALLKSLKDNDYVVKEEPIQPRQQSKLSPEKKMPVKPLKISQLPEEKKTETIPVEMTAPPVMKKEKSDKIPEKLAESKIIADKFSHLANRFNEQLRNRKGDDDLSEMMKTKPLTSLSEAIG